jgi:hypothetical protein
VVANLLSHRLESTCFTVRRMDDPPADAPTPTVAAKTARPALDICAVVLMSIVAVLTAWCGFESSKWGGAMSIAFSQASSLRVAATAADSEARDARQVDVTIYAAWIEAAAAEDEALSTYIEDRFTPAFAVAFDAWSADGMVEPSPFARAEYQLAAEVESAELTARADAKFQEALDNNQQGDDYSLLTVLFALVLFFAAVSQRSGLEWAMKTMLGVALTITVVAVVVLATFPVKL